MRDDYRAGMNRRLLLPALCVLLAACSSYPSSKHELRIRDDVPAGGDRFSLALLQSVGVGMAPGHRVELVNNGAVFDAVVEEISRAQSSIHVDTFIA
jgi:cardiolipin synthase